MANPWFRVWTDMINDPKWRTIARVSKQKVGDVIAAYIHMLTLASNASERGRTEGWSDEDIATALDIDTEQVTAIREAMQGRVLDGDYLTGWEKRQPDREDGSAERAKAWREDKKRLAQAKTNATERDRTQTNETERNRTPEEIRREEIRIDKTEPNSTTTSPAAPREESTTEFEDAWLAYPPRSGASKADSLKAWKARIKAGECADEILAGVKRYAAYVEAKGTEDSYIKQPATFFGPGNHFKSNWTVVEARASPLAGYQSANEKQKSIADRLTGHFHEQRSPTFIDLN